jgi:hypothetical protein
MYTKIMYEFDCETCGRRGVNATRQGAESRAERHVDETDHSCEITTLGGVAR